MPREEEEEIVERPKAKKSHFKWVGKMIKWLFILGGIAVLALFTISDPRISIDLVTTSRTENYVTITYHLSNNASSFAVDIVAYIPVDKNMLDNTPPYLYGRFKEVPYSEWDKLGFTQLDNDIYSLLRFDIGWLSSKYIPYRNRGSFDIIINTKGFAVFTTIGEGKLVYHNVIGSTQTTVIDAFLVNYPST